MANFNILIVFPLLVCIFATTNASNEVDPQQAQDFKTFVELMSKLKYGDPCSWQGEKLRRNFLKEIVLGKLDIQSKLDVFKEFQSTMLKRGEPLCSAVGLFVCSKETNTCVCGDPTKSVLLEQQFDDKDFVVETENDGNKKCRWAGKAGCLSDDFYNSTGAASFVSSDSKCQKGTSCLTAEKQKTCKFTDIVLYAKTNRATDPVVLAKDIYSGKICTCQGKEEGDDQNGQQIDQVTNSRIRRFASAQGPIPDMGVYGGILAPFVY